MARNTLGFDAGSLKLASPSQSLAAIKGIPGFTNGKKRSVGAAAALYTPGPNDGQQIYVVAGTYSWTCPANVTSVCVVAVGAGGCGASGKYGGGGGGLGYRNNYAVTPGNSYTVVVGGGTNNAAGGDSYFVSTGVVKGGGGQTTAGGTYTGDGGGNGGASASGYGSGGGGAGGYAGTGGIGGAGVAPAAVGVATSGTGGAGGGGSGSNHEGGGGGGVGILGQGSSGAGSTTNFLGNPSGPGYYYGYQGQGGSGAPAASADSVATAVPCNFGGGGTDSRAGGVGAVRIVWGANRSYPSTNLADVNLPTSAIVMTSNILPTGYIATMSPGGYGAAYQVFDGITTDQYIGMGSVSYGYWRLQLPTPRKATAYSMLVRSGADNQYPTTWSFQGSNDGTDWTVLDSRAAQSFTLGQTRSFSIASPASYLYYQIYSNTNVNNTGIAVLSEIGFTWSSS